MSNINRLTSLVKRSGCGSKIGPADLRVALENLPQMNDPRLLFGTSSGDDAALFQLTPELALVQTVDFFTPIVDNPYDFGAIAATNALSDCYALGGKPLTALNIVAFPSNKGLDILSEILKGGADKVIEAGAVVVGGHSVEDDEPKFGVCVTGIIDPKHAVLNNCARAGDVLVITKKLGTGIIASWAKKRQNAGEDISSHKTYIEAVNSMKTLNKAASEVMLEVGVSAATDITGFSLLGHVHNLALASNVSVEINFAAIPFFSNINELLAEGICGGIAKNELWLRDKVTLNKGLPENATSLLYDPQTSGPLLIAVPENKATLFIEKLNSRGVGNASVIGKITEGIAGKINITN